MTKIGVHKFGVGDAVMLPGPQIGSTRRGPRYMWNQPGIVEAIGWTKPALISVDRGWSERDANGSRSRRYELIEASLPMYKVAGRWYSDSEVE